MAVQPIEWRNQNTYGEQGAFWTFTGEPRLYRPTDVEWDQINSRKWQA